MISKNRYNLVSLLAGSILAFLLTTDASGANEKKTLPKSYGVKPTLYSAGFESSYGITFDRAKNFYGVNYRGNGQIGRITTEGKATVFFDLKNTAKVEGRKPHASGMKIDKNDRLIVADAGAGRLLRISKEGDKADVLADRYMGNRFQSIENIALDVKKNIYFTDTGGKQGREKPIGAVYRYNIMTGKVSLIAKDLACPGGLAVLHTTIKPKPIKLIVAEKLRYQLVQFDLAEDGTVGEKKVLFKFPEKTIGQIKGGKIEPGGMVFDTDQRLYIIMRQTGIVNVIDGIDNGKPKLIRQYDAGGKEARNCHFSGPFLYTTIDSKEAVFRLNLGIEGYSYTRDAQ